VAPAIVKPEDIFNAIGLLSVAQGFGLVFFVSVAGDLFQNLGVQNVTPFVPASFQGDIRPLIAGTSSTLFSELSNTAKEQVTAGIVSAIGKVYPLSVAAAGLALLMAPFLGVSFIITLRFYSN
jgi:hypothetical protein